MTMPKADEVTRDFFHSVLPLDPRVSVRPMFGNLAAFVNGNMFAGVFGERVFVRLSEESRAELLTLEGAEPFDPMGGRPMKEYVVLPEVWRDDTGQARAWVLKALEWSEALPPKEPKKKR
jgi:TfoX/Sxy family transcriptional regulator of competence genes